MSDSTSLGAVQIGAALPGGRSLRARIDGEMAHLLNHLLHLHFDLNGAYDSALSRIDDDDLRLRMSRMRDSHIGIIAEISALVVALGKTPTRSGDWHGVLERGRVVLGDLRGQRGIIEAMASNEEELSGAYREALAHPGLPADVAQVLSKASQQEAVHRAFYNELLGRFVG